MSIVRHLGWSNSAQSWLERGTGLLVLAAAGVLLGLGFAYPWQDLLILWAAWAVTLAVLVRSGRLHLFGPVLFYDMVRTARRNRYALIRCLYAAFLLLLLFWVYGLIADQRLDNRQQAARLASDFFETYMVVQLIAVVILTPAYVGGAVAEEKERRTLEFILATDLRNQEVILSKLGSRLANLTLFLLTGLPILSLLQFLGGIDPNLVLMGFAATGLTMLGIGCVSLLYSVLLRKPRDAIGMTYLFIIAYFALATTGFFMQMASYWLMGVSIWFGADGPTLGSISTIVNYGNPLALIFKVGSAGGAGALATTLPTLLFDYAVFHLVLSAICLVWSILALRRVGLMQTVGRVIKPAEAHRDRPPVGELPVLWKELLEGKARLGWSSWLSFGALGLLTLGIGFWIIGDQLWNNLGIFFTGNWNSLAQLFDLFSHHGLPTYMNVWARVAGTGAALLTILWAAVRASTSISGERDKQTFDALITTQLSSDDVLGAKLLGCILGVRLGLVWFLAIVVLSLLTGGLHPLALPLSVGAWLLYACFFTMVGLYFSMTCTTTTRATVTTVMVSLALAVGHWVIWFCLIPLFYLGASTGSDSGAEFLANFQWGNTPPLVLGTLLFSHDDLSHDFGHRMFGESLAYSLLGLFLWGAACVALWFGLLSPQFRHLMRREEVSAK